QPQFLRASGVLLEVRALLTRGAQVDDGLETIRLEPVKCSGISRPAARDDGVDLAEIDDAGAFLLRYLSGGRNRKRQNKECCERTHNVPPRAILAPPSDPGP